VADTSRREHITREALTAVISVIIAGIAAVIWRAEVWEAICDGWVWVTDSTSIARWWYGILFFTFIVTFTICMWRLLRPAFRNPPLPEHFAYREDVFLGLVWRWSWSESGAMVNLWCYCPNCDRRSAYQGSADFIYEDRYTVFLCQACGDLRRHQGDREDALNYVRREIELKLRSGAWREVAARQSDNAAEKKLG